TILLGLLAWILTLLITVQVLLSTSFKKENLWRLDGSWFLAPAAYLGNVLVTIAILPFLQGTLRFYSILCAGLGLLIGITGYLGCIYAALQRIVLFKLNGAPPVLWWISAGCGGLTAAAN